MKLIENQTAFVDHFGEDVTIADVPVRGLWDDEYVDPLGVQSSGPAFGGFESDLPAHDVGTVLVRGGVTYQVATVEPDGTGWVVLRLARQ